MGSGTGRWPGPLGTGSPCRVTLAWVEKGCRRESGRTRRPLSKEEAWGAERPSGPGLGGRGLGTPVQPSSDPRSPSTAPCPEPPRLSPPAVLWPGATLLWAPGQARGGELGLDDRFQGAWEVSCFPWWVLC